MAEEQISVVLKANIDNYNKNMSIAAGVLKDLQKQSTEFMKINNGVEDSFTKIDFAAKKFGETAGVLEKKLVVVKKAMTDLVVAGQANTRAFKDLDNQYKIITNRLENKAMAEAQAYAQSNMTNMSLPKMSKGLDQASTSLKKNNLQWTNLALVIQDLPYGFRGIQNNLPAVIGGFAGMTGAIYLATSVIIAFFTAWDNGMIKFSNSLSSAEVQQKAFNDILDKSKDSYTEVKTQVMLLNDQVAEAAGKKDLERKAVKDYNDTIGESLGKLKTFKEVQDSLINQGDKYIDYIFKLNMANTAASKVAEESANMLIASFKKPLDFVNNIDKLFSVQFNMFGNLAEAAAGTAKKLYESGKQNQQEAIQGFGKSAVAAEAVMKLFREQAKEAKKLLNFGTFDDKGGKKGKTPQQLAEEKARLQKIANDAETQAFIDTLDERAQKEYKAGLELATGLEKMKAAGYTNSETYYAAYRQNMLNIAKEYDDKEFKTAKDNADKIAKIQLDTRFDLANAIRGINQKFLNDDVTSIQNKAKFDLKLNKNNRKANIQSLKDANKELLALKESQFNADKNIDTSGVDQGIENNLSQIALLEQTWKDTANSINSSINNLISNGITLLADSLGKAFAGESVDIFNSLGLLIADALINVGKSLIEYATLVGIATALFADPLTWPVALGVGIAAVAAGAFLKSKLTKKEKGVSKFADGGIVSGPTMGLMGEYPGARNNPEVVAPLDKLKGLMGGGGGGTLEARISGNDLLILMNKAQRNNNTTF
jgi:hypothetical protein